MSGPVVCGLFGGALGPLGWLAFALVFGLLGAFAYAAITRLTQRRPPQEPSGDELPAAPESRAAGRA